MSEEPLQKLTLKKDAMIQALTVSLGNVTEATAAVGMSRETHYACIRRLVRNAEIWKST